MPNADDWLDGNEPPEEVYLCLLDVLGFRSFVHGRELRTVAKALSDARAKISATIPDDIDDVYAPDSIMYSDSVLFWVEGTRAEHLRALTRTVQSFFAALFQDGLLLRGAIVKGELSIAAEGEVIVGGGLVRAYELEQGQKWGGIVLDPRLSKDEPDGLDDLFEQEALVEQKVPWSSNPSPRRHTVVCWPAVSRASEEELQQAYRDSFSTVAEDGRAKLDATLQFFEEYKGNGA